MKDCNSIITYIDYGYIVYDIRAIMKKRHLTKNQILKKTGLHHQVIDRYMSNSITRFDKDILAKLCYVLDCRLDEIIYYVSPNKED